jgi:hypothetical protein
MDFLKIKSQIKLSHFKTFRKSQNHPDMILNPILQNRKSNRFIPWGDKIKRPKCEQFALSCLHGENRMLSAG